MTTEQHEDSIGNNNPVCGATWHSGDVDAASAVNM